nr:hypothetical protein [Bradyrhizobium sp. 169]
MPSQGVHLFWWTPHASEHSKAKGAGKFALTSKARTPVVKIAKMTKRTEGALRQKAIVLGIGLGHQR